METAKLTVRIDRDDLKQLQTAAENDKRSVNQQILYYIKRALTERQPSP